MIEEYRGPQAHMQCKRSMGEQQFYSVLHTYNIYLRHGVSENVSREDGNSVQRGRECCTESVVHNTVFCMRKVRQGVFGDVKAEFTI